MWSMLKKLFCKHSWVQIEEDIGVYECTHCKKVELK
jgi:hypothetical protein